MNPTTSPKKKWWIWTYLVSMIPLLYVIVMLIFGDFPLIERVTGLAQRGQVPDVSFVPSNWMWLLVLCIIVFFTLMFQVMRHWALYYLSRKLLLSYMFFALIPLLTAILIFVTITRVMLGISSLLTFEDATDRYAYKVTSYARMLRSDLYKAEIYSPGVGKDKITEAVNRLKGKQPTEDTEILVMFVSDKIPGQKRFLVPLHSTNSMMNTYFMEGTPKYEEIWPSWMEVPEWKGMVNIDGKLYIRYFLYSNKMAILVTTPLDSRFLRSLPGFQVIKVTMESVDGSSHISTTNPNVSWYHKLPFLSLFSSRWDSGAFNWQSGLFQKYGNITFGLELARLGSILDNSSSLDFFYSGQQLSSLKLILGTILIVMLCVLIALIFGGYLVSYITRSLNLLAEGHEAIAQGRLNFRLPYIGKDQLGAMGTSFNAMVSSIDNLMVAVTEKEKYHQELRIARDIQMSLLPNVRDIKWATNIAANCIPAHDVGGDYYEIVRTEAGEIGIFIADVSGKGTSAAFYMAELKGVLIALRHLWNDPRELMCTINEIMKKTLSANVFVSGAYLLIDPKAGKGTLARAGHCPAFHIKADGSVDELSPPGMAIGIAPNTVFGRVMKTISFPMDPEDKILLYTDGLDEMTKEHELYGIERLRDVLTRNTHLDVDGLKQAILDDVLGFLSTGVQNDDLTLVVAGLPVPVEEPEKRRERQDAIPQGAAKN